MINEQVYINSQFKRRYNSALNLAGNNDFYPSSKKTENYYQYNNRNSYYRDSYINDMNQNQGNNKNDANGICFVNFLNIYKFKSLVKITINRYLPVIYFIQWKNQDL